MAKMSLTSVKSAVNHLGSKLISSSWGQIINFFELISNNAIPYQVIKISLIFIYIILAYGSPEFGFRVSKKLFRNT